ncbi:prolyl oligopeptidase family serine peptidase [Gillisia mitskevichiae]|uniref:prolyl oligopeptidase family serine peptidase n=1 Tax=Gillisia mitskevichiae TaxID=270921 RepID=UPI0021D2257F|nr:prolyl oligopeptidase family serine peptidase [Gillisia mitskevichiae]
MKKEEPESKTYSYYYYEAKEDNIRFRPLLKNLKYELNIRGFEKNRIIARTAMNNKQLLVAIDPKDPGNWKNLSPTYENAILTGQEVLEDKIILSYQGEANDFIIAIDYDGQVLNELSITPGLSLSTMNFNEDSKRFIYSVESFTIPQVLYKLDLEKFTSELYDKTKVNFDFKDYKFRKTTFKSHDGVEVPIFIVFKNELKTDGSTPFLLKTYGGYGNMGTPRYDPGIIYFLENDGAFAYVDVRGGGKLGNSWWQDGKNLKKKNSFMDFISASEFLIEKGYTSPKKIAITGASHGGLVMGAAITMRPDLYGSAAIDVGVLDMLRFENFTVGATNTNLSEFGSVKNEEEFKNLLSYSPYHNLDYNKNYPSTLIMTGKYDDRVPPLHSYKFTALMQNNPNQKNPVLLWTQNKTGHYGASNMEDKVLENSFKYGFLLNELK